MSVVGEKIVILGGGMAALTSAYFLTDPALRGRYEVTVHTMGWRLGGKGASGRNMANHARIEEHGLHIWFGTYHNAIAMMRRCYAELGRAPSAPLATFDDAFKPQRRVVVMEKVAGNWRPWEIDFPDLPPLGALTVFELLTRLVHWIGGRVMDSEPFGHRSLSDFTPDADEMEQSAIHAITGGAGPLDQTVAHVAAWTTGQVQLLGPLELVPGLFAKPLAGALKLMARMLWAALGSSLEDDKARRLWIMAYLGITFARGMLVDRLFQRGFDAVEAFELREWLVQHSSFDGSNDQPLADDTAFLSPVLQAFYDATFSYDDGDAAHPNIGAGTGIRGILRVLLDYSGSLILEMQAGMGDAVFMPLYLVLKRRGVRFEFFSRVTGLELGADGQEVQRIKVTKQVRLPPGSEYDPVIKVKDLECWPSRPDFTQIEDGEDLEQSGANLEHWESGWPDTGGEIVLERGTDFKCAVLAISYDVLPKVTPELESNRQWAEMVAGLDTAPTQAAQLWFARSRAELGLAGPPEIFGSYVEPWSSLVDFSHLLEREDWPVENAPQYLLYTCGPLAKADAADDEAVFQRLRAFLQDKAAALWPGAVVRGDFDDAVLFTPDAAIGSPAGDKHLRAQYWHANTDPTARYVTSKAGTLGCRLRADQSGFGNLMIAGEWTATGFTISSIEAAVISGMRVSRAMAGIPGQIAGESDV